jgi:hypothetical protein
MKQHRTTRGTGRLQATARSGRIAGVTAVAAAIAMTGAVVVAPSAASAATSTDPARVGLFGSQDPTYDGVYRQSLSLIVLDAADANVPTPAVKWLKRQQCGNGSFTSFRSDLDAACGPKDSNATALAVIAFKRIGERKHARQAINWLIDQQKRSGGWEYTAGWGEDSNSTGLAIQALIAMKVDPRTVAKNKTGLAYLRSLQLDCDNGPAADRGALDYQKIPEVPLAANDFATAQATAALAGSTLPVQPHKVSTQRPAFTCDDAPQPSAAAAAAGYLGRTIKATGGYIPSFDDSPDYGSTANAVLSLVAGGYASNQIEEATDTLKGVAADYSRGGKGKVLPASAAALGLVAIATGGDPRHFGGTNPVRDLLQSRTTRG